MTLNNINPVIFPASTCIHGNNSVRFVRVVSCRDTVGIIRIIARFEEKRGTLSPATFAAGFRYVMELRNSAHRSLSESDRHRQFTNSANLAESDSRERLVESDSRASRVARARSRACSFVRLFVLAQCSPRRITLYLSVIGLSCCDLRA